MFIVDAGFDANFIGGMMRPSNWVTVHEQVKQATVVISPQIRVSTAPEKWGRP